nr:hypothetical protein Iba_scaffold69465CG0010 [Ipomoea batatas]
MLITLFGRKKMLMGLRKPNDASHRLLGGPLRSRTTARWCWIPELSSSAVDHRDLFVGE